MKKTKFVLAYVKTFPILFFETDSRIQNMFYFIGNIFRQLFFVPLEKFSFYIIIFVKDLQLTFTDIDLSWYFYMPLPLVLVLWQVCKEGTARTDYSYAMDCNFLSVQLNSYFFLIDSIVHLLEPALSYMNNLRLIDWFDSVLRRLSNISAMLRGF